MNKKTQINVRGIARLALFGGTASMLFSIGTANGQEAKAGKSGKETIPVVAPSLGKPAWLTELSLGVKEGYDSNLLGQGTQLPYAAPSAIPKSQIYTLNNIDSWVTTISPKIGIDFVPFLGDQKVFQTLAIGYAGDYSIYTNDSNETNYANRFSTAIKGKIDAFKFSIDNVFTYVDGSKIAPTYPGGYRSAYATAIPRERRNQDQDRSKIFIQYDNGKFFVRPIATLLYYNLNTVRLDPNLASTPNGYQNYANRSDVNGGVDLGYKVLPDVAATIGYRYGSQYQQSFSWAGTGGDSNPKGAPYSSSNTYNRLLFGSEGKVAKWLTFQFQLGPDFRSYQADSASHITPVNNLSPVVFYGDASVTADITSVDKLAFLFKDWRWVSSTGLVPYQDSSYNLTYTRKLSDKLTASFQTIAANSNYSAALGTNGERNDWLFTISPGLRYTFNSHFTATLAYSANWGVNGFGSPLPKTSGGLYVASASREFFENVISLGGQVAF